jgi:hypothetical protein
VSNYQLGRAITQTVSSRDRAQVGPCGVGFVVDKVALEQVFLRVLQFSSVSIIPPLLHIHSCIIWGMDSGPVSGHSSTETQSHHTETIKNLSSSQEGLCSTEIVGLSVS